MSEWTSLSCKAETKERVKALQKEDEGQDDVLNRALDALEGADNTNPWEEFEGLTRVDISSDEIEAAFEDFDPYDSGNDERIDELLELVKDMDVVSNNQRVLTRIDDLETELKTHFERELGR